MSKSNPLLANLKAFKSKVKSAPVLGVPRPGSNSRANSNNSDAKPIEIKDEEDDDLESTPQKKRNRPEEEIDLDDSDYDSSPSKRVKPGSIAAAALQASQSDISKSHDSSKLLWATEYIQKKGKPVPLTELMDYLSMKKDDKVIELLKKLERIEFDEKKGAFKYLSTYDVHSAQELLNLLRSQVTFKGISFKDLKDGWPQCEETINDLEEESKILVLRTKKDKTPRYVWYNRGGNLNCIDEEFVKIWENVQLPQFAELPRKLQELGLKPASVDPASIKRQTTRVEVKKKRNRRGKITNTHMAGILKDYSHKA
ncbi:Transcription initiation factor IIE subunit beta [Nakaseomyces bracarensis]|uniref:Transcription initiation factor IIE subunit beta n=1 Tax=Nakaseomyces bracarensis TaxID=273131 RepID=A0ABR4NM84_9SACH